MHMHVLFLFDRVVLILPLRLLQLCHLEKIQDILLVMLLLQTYEDKVLLVIVLQPEIS